VIRTNPRTRKKNDGDKKNPKSKRVGGRIRLAALTRAETKSGKDVKPNPSCRSSGELMGVELRNLPC